MNAPAQIPAQQAKPLWHRYIPAVDAFVPNEPNDRRKLRAQIMAMRDQASRILRDNATDHHAGLILGMIETLGCTYATASIDGAKLDLLRRTMTDLYGSAIALQLIGGEE